LSGIDVALWDIIGKALGVPLYRLFGGYSERVRAYASGGFYSEGKGTGQIAEEMAGYVSAGYTAVKMKVGRNDSALNPLEVMPDPKYRYSLETDLERVAAVKKAVGKDVRLLVDANAAWDLHTAIVMGREFDKLGVYLFEEPVSTDNTRGSAELAAALDLKIAGYESEQLAYNFERLITGRCVDLAQPDLAWTGGFTECRKIAALAYANHMEVAPHCFSSAVNLMASLHFLGSVPNGGMLEMDRNPNALRTEIMKDMVAIDKDGYVSIPDRPGLGVELDMDAVGRYLVEAR
jgi:L-alanine-DL-glutamate epimerase-like enolase superfamily enzyme